MALLFSLLSLLTLLPTALGKLCQNITVPVNISARNGVFDLEQPETNRDVTQFSLNTTNIKWNFTLEVLTGYQTVTGTYNISVKFCQPDDFDWENGAVQVLTHGIGFDKTCGLHRPRFGENTPG